VVSGGNTTYESTISYTYDAGNRMTQAVDTAGGTITEGYDGLNRLTSETTSLGSISYGYDAAGRQTSMTVAGQPAVTYTYDNADRLTQIARSTATTGFGYDNANRRTSLTLPNGVAVTYGYDNGSHLTGITYQFGSNTLGNLSYTYDQLGRRAQVAGTFARTGLPGAVASTGYDAANELTNWNGLSISYDSNGNMLSDGSNIFTWNARNQVATLNGVNLQYDAAGRRSKNAAGKSFLYDGVNSAQELLGTTPTANIWTGGMDEFFQRTDSNGIVVPITDAQGSVLALADANGNVTTQYSYDPFGNTTAAGAASNNPSQYTGRENEGNGLYYYRARYYNPLLGRFIREDPLGFAGSGSNLYAYVEDDPIDWDDPLGLAPGAWWDPRTYKTLPHELNPFNPNGTFYEEANAIGDSFTGMVTWNWDKVRAAAPHTPLGLTEMYGRSCDPFDKYVGYYGTRVALIGAAAADAAALGLIVAEATIGLQTKVAIHGAHHTFGSLGRLVHIQLNTWIKGVSGSGWVFRIPLPWR
jgi:RHS repeat-associated protein